MAVTCSAAAGQKYPNYNVREFVKRRAKQDFRQHAAETDAARIDQLWSKAQEDFAVTQRQRLVYSMYAPKQKSVMVSIPSDGQLQWLAQAQAAAFIETPSQRLLGCLGPSDCSAARLLHLAVDGIVSPSLAGASVAFKPHAGASVALQPHAAGNTLFPKSVSSLRCLMSPCRTSRWSRSCKSRQRPKRSFSVRAAAEPWLVNWSIVQQQQGAYVSCLAGFTLSSTNGGHQHLLA